MVSASNLRYFAVRPRGGGEQVVYLTGSHIWNNLQDGLGPGLDCGREPEANDYVAYLDFLKDHGHNFIRLWRWEHTRSQAPGAPFHLCMTPQPWARTGPGVGADNKPRFDLSQFDEAYFDRLRERVVAAGDQGIYVSIMLFDGFCLIVCPSPDNVAGHPFAEGNNVNGTAIASVQDYNVLPIDPQVRALQTAYIHKVIDTVHDLPNVLYEVANESAGDAANPTIGDSTSWQYWVIDSVKAYEAEMGYDQHPVGMTFQIAQYEIGPNGLPVQPPGAEPNRALFEGPADWVSPGFEREYFTDPWFTDPPSNDGTKVVLSDTDHYASGVGDALWAWKSFLRGHNPILMDFGIIDVVDPLDPSLGVPPYASFEAARLAMGDTLRLAQGLDLGRMTPHGELSSTGYALADPGREYVVLEPDGTGSLTLELLAGRYKVEWYNVTTRETNKARQVVVQSGGVVALEAPVETSGPRILHLTRVRP